MEASGSRVWATCSELVVRGWVVPFNRWFKEWQEAREVIQMHDCPSQTVAECSALSVVHDHGGNREAKRGRRV